MEKLSDDFISHDRKKFKYRLGKVLASSLSGFIAGLIVASIIFLAFFDLALKGSNLGF